MPSTGTPDGQQALRRGRGAVAYTEAGSPDKMIALAAWPAFLSQHRRRDDLGVDVALAHPPRDELGVLGTKSTTRTVSKPPGTLTAEPPAPGP